MSITHVRHTRGLRDLGRGFVCVCVCVCVPFLGLTLNKNENEKWQCKAQAEGTEERRFETAPVCTCVGDEVILKSQRTRTYMYVCMWHMNHLRSELTSLTHTHTHTKTV